jgi:hypothetical protein
MKNLRQIGLAAVAAVTIQAGCNTPEEIGIDRQISEILDSNTTCIEKTNALDELRLEVQAKQESALADAIDNYMLTESRGSYSQSDRLERVRLGLDQMSLSIANISLLVSPECREQQLAAIRSEIARCRAPRPRTLEEYRSQSDIAPDIAYAQRVLSSETEFCELDETQKVIVQNSITQNRDQFDEVQIANAIRFRLIYE